MYGVFDGYNGRTASEFAAQKLPAELLFGQLTGIITVAVETLLAMVKNSVIFPSWGFGGARLRTGSILGHVTSKLFQLGPTLN